MDISKLPNKEQYRTSMEVAEWLYIVPLNVRHKTVKTNEEFAQRIKEKGKRISLYLKEDMTAYDYKWKTYIVCLRDWCFSYYVWLLANSFYDLTTA